MKAILLAAGIGTRLKPLTNTIPKCLVPIGDKALLQIWLERLSAVGIGPFLVNTHYLSGQVEEFIAASKFADQTRLVHEDVLLGTAGTLRANIEFLAGSDGLLIHADNYCEADLMEFAKAHRNRPAECLMTMMTFRTTTPETCGIVELDKNGVVIGFHEKVKTPPGNLANGAVYILGAELVKRMRSEWFLDSDFSTGVIPNLMGKIYAYETPALFADIGSLETYEEIRRKVS